MSSETVNAYISRKPGVCGGKQVVNVTYTLTNDADSGFYGDWATDTLNRSLKVFAVADAEVDLEACLGS